MYSVSLKDELNSIGLEVSDGRIFKLSDTVWSNLQISSTGIILFWSWCKACWEWGAYKEEWQQGYKALSADAKAYIELTFNWIFILTNWIFTYLLNLISCSCSCYHQQNAVEMVLDDSESEPVFEIEVFVSTWCSSCCMRIIYFLFGNVVTDNMFDDKYLHLMQILFTFVLYLMKDRELKLVLWLNIWMDAVSVQWPVTKWGKTVH